ncbi:helix-turn-helix transcriptional regulator [Phytoactinopolyspora halotolerans]|uniref:AAA family ATPase n=1 Tax=Phytoactinopolyspora halotolerans TaxID=1981512 RepID=A0A6L9SEJ2_9ACTN|nr:LuxR family transcriptional regulator [Phytoactinopolyspora halotolerans]NEE03527.1 AAA family ATPase [Phytoactinopolyspora halotolerans]
MTDGMGLVSPALVGRAEELQRAVAAVTSPPALVILDGEAGIGKTRLIAELAAQPELAGHRVLVGPCHRIRESFPLGPVIEALRGVRVHLADVPLSAITGALRPLLPELEDVLPPAPEPMGDRVAERHRIFRGIVEVLRSLGPTVLVLEDMHWADQQTADFVGYLLAESLPELAVLLTFRHADVDPGVRALVATPPPGVRRTDVYLEPLDVEQTGAMAASIMELDRVSDEFATYLRERTAGLPFAIEELLALLQARGTLVRRGGRWARRALDELDVPTKIRDSVLERVTQLGGDAGQVVEAAAALQVPVPLTVLAETATATDDGVWVGVEEALTSGLLAENDDIIGFRHPLAAQAVYEAIPAHRRRLLHGRAAAALRTTDPVPLGQVAHHLRYAGRLDEWVVAAERAADQAIALSNDAEAARLLEDVLRNTSPEPETRGRLAVKLGQAAVEALRAPDVVDLLSEILDDDLPGPIRGELRFLLGTILHDAGVDLIRAHRLIVQAIDDLGHRPDMKAWAMVVLGIPMAGDLDPEEHRRWLSEALTVVPEIEDPVFQVFLLGKIAMVQIPMGDPAWRPLAERVERQTGGSPRRRREINAYWSMGSEASYSGHHDIADRLLAAGLDAATGADGERVELRLERSLRSGLLLMRYLRGAWDGLQDDAAELIDDLAGHPRARVNVDTVAACLQLAQGDLDGAHESLSALAAVVDELGAVDLLPIPTSATLRLATARGEHRQALTLIDRFLETVQTKGVLAPAARALPYVTEALVAAGEVDRAASLLDDYTRKLAELDAPVAPAALEHARGHVQLAEGDAAHAAGHFAAAAVLYEPLPCRYEAAQARELAAMSMLAMPDEEHPPNADVLAGEIGRRPDSGGAADGGTDHPGAARGGSTGTSYQAEPGRVLLSALSTYRELGAEWDVGRVTQVARQHGLSIPARYRGGRRGYGSDLSPREREVAELAAVGRSNREIAAELYISVNTVIRHITAALRKLDVRSRAAIAHRLAELDMLERDEPDQN